MFNQSKKSKFLSDRESQVELELLDSLVVDEIAYPWNPADPESEMYFEAIEEDLQLEELTDETLASRTPTWVAQIEQIWQGADSRETQENGAIEQLKEAICGKFADWVPTDLLETIAHQASKIQTDCPELNQMSLTEQLVQCVQTVLPGWAREDLQVLARPYAFAMRGNPSDSPLAGTESCQWTELSNIERARVSLAIACYALAELNNIEDFRQ
jgi:hypothetical protein